YADPSEIQLVLRSSTSVYALQPAEVIAQQWRDLGIGVEMVTQDTTTLIEYRASGDYQVMIDGRSITLDDPDGMTVLVGTGGFEHAAGVNYSNPELDALLAEGRTTLDVERRKEIYRQVEEILI